MTSAPCPCITHRPPHRRTDRSAGDNYRGLFGERETCSPMSILRLWGRTDHPLRTIREVVNATLSGMSADFAELRSRGPPGHSAGAAAAMERLEFGLLFRWFAGLWMDDPEWDASRKTVTGRMRARCRSAPPATNVRDNCVAVYQVAMRTSIPSRSNARTSPSLMPSSVMKVLTTSSVPNRVKEERLILVESATR